MSAVAKHSFRSAVVLVLFFGTLALAVPSISSLMDAWLFSDDAQRPKWNTQRPATSEPLKPASPTLVPAGDGTSQGAVQPASSQFAADPATPAPLAFEFQQDTPDQRDLGLLQRDLQDLGASYLVVEEIEGGNRFECRALLPLSPQSTYQKTFSGFGSTPQAAMQQVLAEVRAWKRAAQR
jgi:hypothetical protein